MLPSLTLLAEH